MPWKESSVMDERMRFVIRLKDGEGMASLCREFGISRKTGYKILDRYEQCGVEGLIVIGEAGERSTTKPTARRGRRDRVVDLKSQKRRAKSLKPILPTEP